MNTSKRYDEIREETNIAFSPPENERDLYWWRKAGRRWRRTVGLPKLTAEGVLIEAASLLRSISLNTFNDRPDQRAELLRLRDEVSDLATMVVRENWQAYQRDERKR